MPFYYPNWINDFWRILGLIFFDDKNRFCRVPEKRFDESAIRQFCASEGLAFYDTACEVRRLRDNASDAFLEVVRATDVPALLAQIPYCHTLVTTGQKATEVIAQTCGCAIPPMGAWRDVRIDGRALRFWRMPSSSRAYPLPLEKKAAAYQQLFL
jgi:G:T/U-mismatch repair DNA glycosylase